MLSAFHPVVARWFERRFGTPTEPQAAAWPRIAAGHDVLVSAPTGSGKTLAAFLACLDRLFRRAVDGSGNGTGGLPDATEVLYVSPLKALGNDVEKNLREPLAELREEWARWPFPLTPTLSPQSGERELGSLPTLSPQSGERGLCPEIRVLVRSGDTSASRRQAMARRPPHVLVTTPESLYLLLTSERGRAMLRSVRTVVCDELHAIVGDKRGAHLALSLARLDALVGTPPQRIGLSATVHPLDEVAAFLTPRPCDVVEIGRRRPLDLAIEVPDDELSSVASRELWAETYDRVARHVLAHRTTLVFVNTRRLVERASHALAERLGEGQVAAHHGSLSRARRLDTEERLKSGGLRCAVATASLELGIDVGAVELVCQLGSPGALATGVQRIGRSGHWRGAVPKGRLFPLTRDELLECAAFVRGARAGRVEETRARHWPRDVLAQQLVAACAAEPWDEDALFDLVRRAHPYRDLPRAEFDVLVAMLSEGISTRRGRAGALLHRDGVHRRLRGRRGARIAALTGVGAIPDSAQFQVVAEPENAVVGQVDEDFAVESLAGDVFQLGNASWRVRRVENGTVRVEDAHGAPPGIPFWVAEAPGRSAALSEEVSRLRAELEPRLVDPAAAAAWLSAEGALPEPGARQAVEYLAAARSVLGALPTQDTLVAERFFDEAGGMQVVVHAPFGARANRALGLALRKRFCRSFDFELQAAATDEGVLLSLGPQHSFPLESIFALVDARGAEEVLTQAALQSPMFGVRWRWDATRALAIPRVRNGKRIPPNLARMKADDLLAAVFPQAVACQDNAPAGPVQAPDHPLVREAIRDCLYEAMDAGALATLLTRIEQGAVRLVAVDTAEPSPLAHELVGARPWAFLDDAPLEERRARAVALRRALPTAEAQELGALDPAAIAEVREQVAPDVRDGDELHDLLLDLVLLPAEERWATLFDALAADGRAQALERGGRRFWAATERLPLAQAMGHEALARALRGWLPRLGPTTAAELAARLAISPALAEEGLRLLELTGLVLRGRFTADPWSEDAPHWCERNVLARIHRATLATLRREIEPCSPADLVRFLLRWQHAIPGGRLHGREGVSEVVAQLQGFHAAAGAWERELLPARVAGYEPRWLDELCLAGEVSWGRLVVASPDDEPRRHAAPTRQAPVTLALREDLAWLAAAAGSAAAPSPEVAPVAEALARGGALFAGDLCAATGLPRAEVEAALWDLVSSGAVTCDGFAGLRALLGHAPEHGRRRAAAVGGRWSLLRREGAGEREALVERVAGQLLRRWGVVFRDLVLREPGAPPWRDLVRVYRRLEARGELRGGRFVSGFSGEQFALSEAVPALRAVRRAQRTGHERVELSGCDPLNLCGTVLPGPRVAPGERVVYVDGVPASSEPGALHSA